VSLELDVRERLVLSRIDDRDRRSCSSVTYPRDPSGVKMTRDEGRFDRALIVLLLVSMAKDLVAGFAVTYTKSARRFIVTPSAPRRERFVLTTFRFRGRRPLLGRLLIGDVKELPSGVESKHSGSLPLGMVRTSFSVATSTSATRRPLESERRPASRAPGVFRGTAQRDEECLAVGRQSDAPRPFADEDRAGYFVGRRVDDGDVLESSLLT